MQSECISYIPVGLGASEEPENSRQRRRWEKDPPERLLSALEKAGISRAFSTFLIHRGGLISKCIIIRSYFAAAHKPNLRGRLYNSPFWCCGSYYQLTILWLDPSPSHKVTTLMA